MLLGVPSQREQGLQRETGKGAEMDLPPEHTPLEKAVSLLYFAVSAKVNITFLFPNYFSNSISACKNVL